MNDASDIFLAMGLSAAILDKMSSKENKSPPPTKSKAGEMTPREDYLRGNHDELIATATKYSNGNYNPVSDNAFLNEALCIVGSYEGWSSALNTGTGIVWGNFFFPRDAYIHSIKSPAELQRVFRSVCGKDADFRLYGCADRYNYLGPDSCCPNHLYNYIGRVKFEIAKREGWDPLAYKSYVFNYNVIKELNNLVSKEEVNLFKEESEKRWFTTPYINKRKNFLSTDESFMAFNGDFSNYVNDNEFAEPWLEREKELRNLSDTELDIKYAILKKVIIEWRYKKIETYRFVHNGRNNLVTMWDYSPMDYLNHSERVRDMAIRYIARYEGWKPMMCETDVIPPYEWVMFVPTESGMCRRVFFDGTDEHEVPYEWRDFKRTPANLIFNQETRIV